ncbi:MAG: CPBP family intramembrane metalloprotease [Candidatus Heimdallarchaeota archaeon]|nr:CPBP family intramembrane metalloprotease [Candidatus Heimdallarchaeota archaeon]MBY8993775.1 CPBP family intramembrane metalloprotease [Candidatus Heimdallarchaeota archaeon]
MDNNFVEEAQEIIRVDSILRPKIQRIFPKEWILCIVLYILFFIIRGVGSLGPESIRILLLVGFGLMWPLPFIFYSREGWKILGIKKIEKSWWILWGFLLGAGAALLVYFIGWGIFGNTNEHWYFKLLNQVISEEDRAWMSTAVLFPIVTLPSIIFSPVGEELFFRGMIHEAFKNSNAVWRGGIINSLAFALIHIFHYGITNQPIIGFDFQPWTGLLWFFLMVGVSGLFTLCREKSGSIFPAMVAHSAFNLAMNASIFIFLI